MSAAASHPHLRFVKAPESDDQRARQAVIKENRIAAHVAALPANVSAEIDARDPRWILAMQTQARLQGTILTPSRRDQLLKSGKKLGLRPFEANLVIAIVQDRARCGMASHQPLPALALVGNREGLAAPRSEAIRWPRWLLIAASGLAVAAILVRWLLG